MFLVHGHKVEKAGFSHICAVEGYNRIASQLVPLKAAYRKPSAAKTSIYAELEKEFADACEYGICSKNREYFTFRAVYTWGYITVYPTRREAAFWYDATEKDRIIAITR